MSAYRLRYPKGTRRGGQFRSKGAHVVHAHAYAFKLPKLSHAKTTRGPRFDRFGIRLDAPNRARNGALRIPSPEWDREVMHQVRAEYAPPSMRRAAVR